MITEAMTFAKRKRVVEADNAVATDHTYDEK